MRVFAQRYGIFSISPVKSELGANALVYECDGKRGVLVDNRLPGPLLFFTVLHEIGHVATNTLTNNPRDCGSNAIECVVNLWVLDVLQAHIAKDAMETYVAAAHQSEAALYNLVSERLDRDLINCWN
jgi:hypothetical protein